MAADIAEKIRIDNVKVTPKSYIAYLKHIR